MSDYEKMTVAQLKELLKEAGLPVSGKKADLITRLEENMEEYYYDICLHSSDNYDQNAQSILVMKKFGWSIRGPDHLELEEFKSRFF